MRKIGFPSDKSKSIAINIMATKFKNEQWAMIELRKHFAHFVRGVKYASSFRERLIRVESINELEEIFQEIESVYKESKGIAGR